MINAVKNIPPINEQIKAIAIIFLCWSHYTKESYPSGNCYLQQVSLHEFQLESEYV
jgi:hypothetical protein